MSTNGARGMKLDTLQIFALVSALVALAALAYFAYMLLLA